MLGRPDGNDNMARSGDGLLQGLPWNALIPLAAQTVALVAWLTTIRAELTAVQRDHGEMHTQLTALDNSGSRALETIRQRQNDVIVANVAQDARLRELENKISDLQRQSAENRIWIDQLTYIIRTFSHPGSVMPLPPKLQSDEMRPVK